MKKLIILIFLLFNVGVAFGQNKTIIIDFSNFSKPIELGNLNNYKELKFGEYYVIKVTGINQVNYMVSVNQKDTLTTKELKLPTVPDFNLESIVAALATIDFAVTPEAIVAEDSNTEENKFMTYSRAILISSEITEELIFASNKLIEIHGVILSFNQQLNNQITNIEDEYFSIKNIFIKSRLSSIPVDASEALCKFNWYKSDLNNSWAAYSSNSIIEEYLGSEKKLVDKFNSIDVDKLNDREKVVYADLKWKFDRLIKNKDEVFANKAKLEDNFKNAKKLVSDENWEKMMVALTFIENLQSDVYYSMPIQYLGEKSKVTVSITPRDPAYKLNSYSTSFVFPLQKTPYSGVSTSFYFSGLRDDNFSVKQETSDGGEISYRLVEENGNKFETGTAILAKMGQKTKDNLGRHLSLGLGISFTEKVRPRFLAGGGFSFGLKNSLVLDAGLALGQVDRLSVGYQDLSQTFNEPQTQVTISKLRVNGFLAVGYFFRF